MAEYTIDDFLGGKVKLKQHKEGYRATSDAVLLASVVSAKPCETVLDVGCGSGIVGLSIAARVPTIHLTGLEIQQDLAELARENAVLNKQEMLVVEGNVSHKIADLHGALYNHVVTNPPFYTETPKRTHPSQEIAYKQNMPLKNWIDFCVKHVRAKGTFSIIHRTEAVPEILSALQGRLGGIVLIPLYSKAGVPPKRIIIQGIQGSKKPFSIHTGLILYNADDTRTDVSEQILRHGAVFFEAVKCR